MKGPGPWLVPDETAGPVGFPIVGQTVQRTHSGLFRWNPGRTHG